MSAMNADCRCLSSFQSMTDGPESKSLTESMRRSRVNPVSKKRAAIAGDRRQFVRRIIGEREWCEARLAGCQNQATDVHEIKTRARGGDILDETNVLALCRACHSFITVNPAFALEHGFVVHSWATDEDMTDAAIIRARTYGA